MQNDHVPSSSEEAPDGALQDVRLVLREMLKVIKAVSLYPESNPLPQSMKRTFAENLESLVADYGRVSLKVEKDSLTWNGKTVFTDQSKEESLAGLFFNAGIDGIAFEIGIEVNDIFALLGVLKEYLNAPKGGYDLVAGIWESGLSRFSVNTVEDVALEEYEGEFRVQELGDKDDREISGKYADVIPTEAYQSIFTCEEPSLDVPRHADSDSPLQNCILAEDDSEATALRLVEASEAMGFGDAAPVDSPPDANLAIDLPFRLSAGSEEEEARIREIAAGEGRFDEYESTAELAKEMLHQETDLQEFAETVALLGKTVTELVQHAELVNAGMLIDYMSSLAEQIRSERPSWSERLREARIAAGSRDQLRALVETLNRNPQLDPDQLRRYLGNFGWEALGGITEMFGSLDHDAHRKVASDFLVTHGRNHVRILSRGIYDKRSHVVRNAIILLSRIATDEVLPHLRKALNHKDKDVRLQLVWSLRDIPHKDVLDILKTASNDPDYQVRREAIDAIVARRGPAAFETIADIISENGFQRLDHDERQTLLVAYSALGGEHALEYLSKLILQPNPFRNQTLLSFREAAFVALAHNRSKKSEKLLLKLRGSLRPHIKRLAADAIRLRRGMIYGDGNDD